MQTPPNKTFRENGACWVIRILSGNSLLLLLHAPVLTFWSKYFHWFWVVFPFIFMSLWIVLETFWVRQIKKLEENNHRFASALATVSILLTVIVRKQFTRDARSWLPSMHRFLERAYWTETFISAKDKYSITQKTGKTEVGLVWTSWRHSFGNWIPF